MSGAKDLVVKPIKRADADTVIQRYHYSGKTVRNSQLHLGVFLGGRLLGAMQFGPSLDKGKIVGLVRGTEWNGFIELNRMAFSDALPRNAESRALGIAFRMFRKEAPHVKWCVSFADATQCGDGTIYRASGFLLTGVTTSKNLARLPDGSVIHKMSLESGPTRPRPELGGRTYYDVTGGRYDFAAYVRAVRGTVIPGFQIRYVKFIDPTWSDRLTVPVLPYDHLREIGASMYRGVATAHHARAVVDSPGLHPGEAFDPTRALNST